MEQRRIIDRLAAAFHDDPSVRGLFLSGSFGRGTADAISDIDVVAVVAEEDQPAFRRHWRTAIDTIDPVVHWQERAAGGLLVNAVTATWSRIDLMLLAAGLPPRSARDAIQPLIDRDGLWSALPACGAPLAPDPTVVARLTAEAIRILGLLTIVVLRGELVNAVTGAAMLREGLIALMQQQVAVPDRGGALRLSALLPPERMHLLATLPSPRPDRAEVIGAHLAIARAFFPIARELCAALDLAWPAAFEQATRAVVRERLGIVEDDLW